MAMAALPSTPPDLNVITKSGTKLHLHQPTGTVEIRSRNVYTQLRRTLGGLVTCTELPSSPSPLPLLTFQIPCDALKDYSSHLHSISAAISTLNLHLPNHNIVVHEIASLAFALADPLNFMGYYVQLELEFLHFQEFEERINLFHSLFRSSERDGDDTLIFSLLEIDGSEDTSSSYERRGASTTAVEKLMKKGRVVAGECDDRELGTCSICLDELSSSCCSGVAELIRTPCTHLYHQKCLLRWLKDNNTCPICRREVD